MIGTIAWYEFWFTVKKKSYYLVTLGMPLLIAAYMGFIGLIALASVSTEMSKLGKPTGLIDRTGILTADGGPLADAKLGEEFVYEGEPDKVPDEIPDDLAKLVEENVKTSQRKIILFSSLDDARKKLEDESVLTTVVIPEDYLESGMINVYKQRSELMGGGPGTGWLADLIGKELLSTTDLSESEIDRIRNSASKTEYEIGKSGDLRKSTCWRKAFHWGFHWRWPGC